MSRRLALLALLAACAAQWAVPAWLIARGEATLARGSAWRFRTAPVDPVDPFRGRYVALDFEAARLAPPPPVPSHRRGARLYAPVFAAADGFARLGAPALEPPAAGDWIEVRVAWRSDEALRLALPFDRYYLDERDAPALERRHRDAVAAGDAAAAPAHAVVRIRDGYALIESLVVDGEPVEARRR